MRDITWETFFSKNHTQTGDNTEKIWAHWFLVKPKTVATRGLGGPGWCLVEGVGTKPKKNFTFFSYKTC